MFDFLADFLVRALSHFCNVFEDLGIFYVMVDVEMLGFIGVPFEFGILDFVFPVVRHVIVLGGNLRHQEEKQ
ncbi:hypothetical protein ES703_83746 [subsurface metagenome]